MLKGYRKMGLRIDSRLPITLPILLNINDVIPSLCSNVYNAFLFKAMCTTAIFCIFKGWGNYLLSPVSSGSSSKTGGQA
jgi:hypothetical protein